MLFPERACLDSTTVSLFGLRLDTPLTFKAQPMIKTHH